MRKFLATLTIVAAATAGVTIPAVAAEPAQAATCKKVIVGYTKPSKNPICWFTPSNPACFAQPIYHFVCGGKF